jgi:hypothetical protein
LRLKLFLLLAALLSLAPAAHAKSARDLGSRMRIDGYTSDFITGDEDVFGLDPRSGGLQEPNDDSKWGNNEEVTQIRVTWDAQYLYLAVEGVIWGNNMIIFLDTVPDRGMSDMSGLNSWRRNFKFDKNARFAGDEFAPDIFGATWDTNTSPHFLTMMGTNQVDDHLVGSEFKAVATFDQGNTGRSMEYAIPWRNVFAGIAGVGTRDTVVNIGGVVDTLHRMPIGVHKIKLTAVVTGGGDGTGGPDSAPDNLTGHTSDSNAQVLIDNYAILDLDENNDLGGPNAGSDGIPDWGVSPISRISFRYPPPIRSVRFSLADLTTDRPAFAPDRGESMNFHFKLSPPLNPDDALDRVRTVALSANLFDVTGHWVRNLFLNNERAPGDRLPSLLAINADQTLTDNGYSHWDGRDASGRVVPAGIYILRVVMEPNLDRAVRAVVVVR